MQPPVGYDRCVRTPDTRTLSARERVRLGPTRSSPHRIVAFGPLRPDSRGFPVSDFRGCHFCCPETHPIDGEAEMSGRMVAILLVAVACAGPAGAEWVRGMMIEECSEESRDLLADSVRRDIELSVRRAEASMEPPASIGDLGCLDGLMDANIDVFAPVGPLSSLFSNSLDGLLTAPGTSRRICRFAHRRWNEVSRPLLKPLDLLQLGLPPDFAGSFNAVAEAAAADAVRVQVGGAAETDAVSSNAPSGSGADSGRRSTGGFDPVGDIWNMLYGKGRR